MVFLNRVPQLLARDVVEGAGTGQDRPLCENYLHGPREYRPREYGGLAARAE